MLPESPHRQHALAYEKVSLQLQNILSKKASEYSERRCTHVTYKIRLVVTEGGPVQTDNFISYIRKIGNVEFNQRCPHAG